jgi:hypothetical protein
MNIKTWTVIIFTSNALNWNWEVPVRRIREIGNELRGFQLTTRQNKTIFKSIQNS